jgi:hypothetical protein
MHWLQCGVWPVFCIQHTDSHLVANLTNGSSDVRKIAMSHVGLSDDVLAEKTLSGDIRAPVISMYTLPGVTRASPKGPHMTASGGVYV